MEPIGDILRARKEAVKQPHHKRHVRSHIAFRRGWTDKLADVMTVQFGTVWFLIFNAIFFLGWIEWNLGLFGLPVFDPYPFNFLTMTVSLEAIFLAIVVLISQNRQSHIADIRQQIDMEVDVRAEEEIIKILRMLEDLHRHLAIDKVDEELKEMEEGIDIATIQSEIERNSDF